MAHFGEDPVNPGSIKAKVVDMNDLGMKDVTITAAPTKQGITEPTPGRTDSQGDCTLTADGNQQFDVTATKEGYVSDSPQPVKVTVPADGTVDANFTLKPASN